MIKNGYQSFLTDEEEKSKAISKHKYLSTCDANTTSSELGYRIDGIAGYRRRTRAEVRAELLQIKTVDKVMPTFQGFVEIAATDDGQNLDGISPAVLAHRISDRLRLFCKAMEKSDFVAQHEIIGSSVLIVADVTGNVGAFWIDFAKTFPCSTEITHRDPWVLGNHEDGFF